MIVLSSHHNIGSLRTFCSAITHAVDIAAGKAKRKIIRLESPRPMNLVSAKATNIEQPNTYVEKYKFNIKFESNRKNWE